MAGTCPICLDNLDLDGKVKASPDACEHIFCLPCLEKWSKLGSYCPVDRIRYKKIVNLESESVIQVKPRKRKRKRIVYDFSTRCETCLKDDYPDTLLLCDCCDLGFHCQCLTPPLETVPAGLWFCPTCVTVEEKLKQKKGITKEMELDYDVFLQKINYYQPVLPDIKKQKFSTPVKSEGVQDTFNDIISVFEDINVVPDADRNINTELNITLDDDDKTPSSKSSPQKAIKVNLPENLKNDLKLSSAFHPAVVLKKISILDFFTISSPKKNYSSSNESTSGKFFLPSNSDDRLIIESVVESELPDENYYDLIYGSEVCDSPITPSVEEHFPPIQISEIRTNISLNRCKMCSEVIFRSFNGSSLCKICKRHSKSQYSETSEKSNCGTDIYSIDADNTVRRNLFFEQTGTYKEEDFISNDNYNSLQSNNYETL